LGHHRGRAGGDRGFNKPQAVRFAAGDGDEDVAVFDRAAVRRHSADGETGVAPFKFRVRRQNLAKLHLKLLGGFLGRSVDKAAKALPAFLD
jgi:hypothetical protein